jgi:hypothetical protein
MAATSTRCDQEEDPDARHGGIFQFDQQFVERALGFLGATS